MNKIPFSHDQMVANYYFYPIFQFVFLILFSYLLSIIIHRWQ